MTTKKHVSFSPDLEKFSLFQGTGGSYEAPFVAQGEVDFQEILLSLASTMRREDLNYHIEYFRPDQPEFRLRSDREPGEDVHSESIPFSQPGRHLKLSLELTDSFVFEALCTELQILGEFEKNEQKTIREPELNLLVARIFQVELYAEYQRWKRYDSPFLTVVVSLGSGEDWKPAARALKHIGGTQDTLGLINRNQVGSFFPSTRDPDPLLEEISERIEAHYATTEPVNGFYIPDDISDWNALKKAVFTIDEPVESLLES